MNVNLYIMLEPANGNPVTLARIARRQLLVEAAEAAIEEARARISAFSEEDEQLGLLQEDEADRLERALKSLIPELRSRLSAKSTVGPLM